MYCKKCGTQNLDGAAYCRNCGEKLVGGKENTCRSEKPTKSFDQAANTQKQANDIAKKPFDESDIPAEYRPIRMWGYFGYQILFSIPIIGFILLIVFAVTAKNKNLKNFARSYFCFYILILIIVIIVLAFSGGALLYSI